MTVQQEELLARIRELEKENSYLHQQIIKEQRYGLTWIDVAEAFEPESENKIPILEEVKEKSFTDGSEKPTHILIEGDNYHAFTCLQYTHKEKIDVIYIDPPYNTGSDGFTYKDNRYLTQFPDGTPVPKDHPYRHSYWLSFMHKRLELAKNLLSPEGVIFISIDDNEQANLKLLCDKVFGEKNFVAQFNWRKKTGANDAKDIAVITESVLLYAKDKEDAVKRKVWNRDEESRNDKRFKLEDEFFKTRGKYYLDTLDRGGLQYSDSMNFGIEAPDGTLIYPNGRSEFVNDGWIWKWGKDKIQWGLENKFLVFVKSSKSRHSAYTIKYKVYQNVDNEGNVREKVGRAYTNLILEPINQQGSLELKEIFQESSPFSNPKPTGLITFLLKTIVNKSCVILDFFAGSGTTLHATLKLNAQDDGHRQCIMVQQNECEKRICEEVTYERNRRVMQGYTNAKGENVAGLGGSLKYYKTTFVGSGSGNLNRNPLLLPSDEDRITLAQNAGVLVSLVENTLYEDVKTDFYQIFTNNQGKYTAVYLQENLAQFENFKQEIEKLNGQTVVYVFSWGNTPDAADTFLYLPNVEVKSYPNAILDTYKKALQQIENNK